MIEVPHRKYQVGRWQVDCARMTISSAEKTEQLSAKVFEILKLFIISKEHIVSKDKAIEVIWLGNEGVGKTGFTNAVWQLRKAFTDLGAEPDEVFATIQKVGYQMLADIEGIEENSVNNEFVSRYSKAAKYGAVAVIIVVLVAILIRFMSPTIQVEKVTQHATHITNYEGIEKQPNISPDGAFMAFQWRPLGKTQQIYIKNLQNSEAPLRKLTTEGNREISPVWSPTGTEIAYQKILENKECVISIYSLISNENRTVVNGCKAASNTNPLAWSKDGKTLVYNKVLDNRVAIFSYDLASNSEKQVSFPKENHQDLSVTFVENDEKLVIVRSYIESSELVVISDYKQQNVSENSFLQLEARMLSIAWDERNKKLFVIKPENGLYVLVSIDLQNNQQQLIDETATPGTLAVNNKTHELFFTRHYSKEHVEELAIDSGKLIRRVASSSRDLYGHYVSSDNSILFVSNRSGNWEVWQRNQYVSTQRTDNIGTVSIPAVSNNGSWFAMRVDPTGEKQPYLYISKIDGSEVIKEDNLGMPIQNPSWSVDEQSLYFSGFKDGKWGIFKYHMSTQKVEQITHSGEVFAQEGNDGDLYVSRFDLNGIWKFELKSNTFTQITKDFRSKDFASFYVKEDHLYFLKRTETQDLLMKVNKDQSVEVVLQFDVLSIRPYQGISSGADGSVIITRHGVLDADIYSLPL
ncbi:winged helix-turn-helix domain-containing protein [Thalassotalea psychrophila]|uniref:Winged helix-turn-helix domain-containing protein n=1 Tax=Thalassotalea psychrophila TaxID=3065647 RepID=A0ABY9U2A2_9GAMM|nr:winged helix-turn-helix domain-containing protein [Colwelliaceae bacterium SQ149]